MIYINRELYFSTRNLKDLKVILGFGNNFESTIILNDYAYEIWKIIFKTKTLSLDRLYSLTKLNFGQEDVNEILKGLTSVGFINYEEKSNHRDNKKSFISKKKEDIFEGYLTELCFLRDKILRASLDITSKCNLQCIHCYHPEMNKEKDLSLDEIKTIIKKLKSLGVIQILLTGGEPFLRSDITKILDYLDKNNFIVSINTNGTLLTPSILSQLNKYNNIQRIQISLYGFSGYTHDNITSVKNSFKETIENLNSIKDLDIKNKKRLTWVISFTFLKDNYKEAKKVENYCKKNHFNLELNQGLFPQLDGNQKPYTLEPELQVILNNLKLNIDRACYDNTSTLLGEEYSCKAGIISIDVDSKGNVYPCIFLRGNNLNFGNLLRDSPKEIIKKMKKDFTANATINKRKFCPECELKNFCAKCMAYPYLEKGDYRDCSTHLKNRMIFLKKQKDFKKIN